MCDLIIFTVKKGNEMALKRATEFHLSEIKGHNDIDNIDDVSFYVNGHCACELVRVPINISPLSDQEIENIRYKMLEKLSKNKYKKRGWTHDKIEDEISNIISTENIRRSHSFQLGLCDGLIRSIERTLKEVSKIRFIIFIASGRSVLPKENGFKRLKLDFLKENPSSVEYNILYEVY